MEKRGILSTVELQQIKAKAYFTHTELATLAMGNRFAYGLCTLLLGIGVFNANLPILYTMFELAFLGAFLPNHPFDYLYNHLLADRLKTSKLPSRSKHMRRGSLLATIWIATTVYLFSAKYFVAAYTVGGMLVLMVFLTATIDLCIPSLIYKLLFQRRLFPKS